MQLKHFEYHEMLPGLGAFSLRPSGTGDAEGGGSIKKFIFDVFDHVGLQISQHERSRFWIKESFSGNGAAV